MEIEMSNYVQRAIPASCPKELRSKIEAAREQRTKPVTNSPEVWDAMQKFCSAEAEQ